MKGGYHDLDAKANDALRRFFDRTGWSPVDHAKPGDDILDKPFLEWLADKNLADDGTGEDVGDYEVRQRIMGVRTFFAFVASKGIHPATMLKWLVCIGRGIHAEPFDQLTMHEAGELMGETPAAHSFRCKVLSRQIELSGMKGSRLPGQKTKEATENYKKCRRGNKNRLGGKKYLQKLARRSGAKGHVPSPAVAA